MCEYSPRSLRASFEHVHWSHASSVGGFCWWGFPLPFDPPSSPPVKCWRRWRRRQDLPLCWASEVAPPVLPRGRIKLIIFQYFFRIGEDELQNFAIGEINTFRTINVRTYICIGSSISFRKSSYFIGILKKKKKKSAQKQISVLSCTLQNNSPKKICILLLKKKKKKRKEKKRKKQ